MTSEIRFSRNWNNKLSCDYFTTYRLKSERFHIGETFRIMLGGKLLFYADVVEVQHTFLDHVSNMDTMLDAGMSAADFRQMLKTMYKSYNIDWGTRAISRILFKRLPNQRDMAKKQTSEAHSA